MDPEEIRAILSRSRAGVWALIEAAIGVAGSDYGDELRRRRDKIVELLYAPEAQVCRNCNGDIRRDVVEHEPYFPENICNNHNSSENIDKRKFDEDNDEKKKFNNDSNHSRDLNEDFTKSPLTPESNNRNLSGGEEEEDADPYAGLFDDEQTKILSMKEQLEDLNQSEDAVVELLQSLADMDINFQALKETDIGRHVNRLRKHSSNEVRRLVKQLVRKWKETVDDWVKVNQPQATSNLIADGDSPQQNIHKNQQNGHHQVPDFGYSPNPQNGSSSVERKYAEHESKPKPPLSAARREAPSRPPQSVPKSTSALHNRVPQRESAMDDEKLNSARKRLQENYQEAQNAKKQRTIQVMDIHEIPKPKNGFFAKNKGNFQGRHHRDNGADDVTIKILYCGICHSDLHTVKNEWGFTQYPVVPGHEISGLVTKVGNNVEKFKVGDRVGVGVIVGSCRTCDLCQQDLESYCPKMIFTYNCTDKDGTRTYGGYSDIIVVDQHFVIRFPDNVPSDAGAPLLCAGITVYSPMKYYGMTEAGKHLGVAGLGGLGHVAVKFGKAFGMKVTVISTSPKKKTEAINKLGADAFVVSTDAEQLKAATGTMDFIIDTIAAVHQLTPLLSLLKMNGKLITVGLPDKPLDLPIFPLVAGRKLIGGSDFGGIKETQEMLDFCGKHGITADIELIGIEDVNTAMERLAKSDVRYRFVIDVGKSIANL